MCGDNYYAYVSSDESMYFPHKSKLDNCIGYWLASPIKYVDQYCVGYIEYWGSIKSTIVYQRKS